MWVYYHLRATLNSIADNRQTTGNSRTSTGKPILRHHYYVIKCSCAHLPRFFTRCFFVTKDSWTGNRENKGGRRVGTRRRWSCARVGSREVREAEGGGTEGWICLPPFPHYFVQAKILLTRVGTIASVGTNHA